MRSVTAGMIKDFKIMKNGFDFMGYNVRRVESLSFHHMVIPKRDCKKAGLGDGYLRWNGAILVQDTSHDYLHQIERIDRDIFDDITKQLIKENGLERLDLDCIKRIRSMLLYFEKEHDSNTNSKGQIYIKRSYIRDRIDL